MTTLEDVRAAQQTEYAARDKYYERKAVLDAQLQALISSYNRHETPVATFVEQKKAIYSELDSLKRDIFVKWQAVIDIQNKFTSEQGGASINRETALNYQIEMLEQAKLKAVAELAIEKAKKEGTI